jgi:hypothetical protein
MRAVTRVFAPITAAVALTIALLPPGAATADPKNPTTTATASAKQAWLDGTHTRRQNRTKNAASKSTNSSTHSTSTSPQGVNSKGESCDPRKDPDCDSLMNSIKPVTTSDVQEVTAQLKLPNPTPRFGPDPSVNEWKMLAVGYPIWLWTDRPTTVSTTAHHDGLDFTLTATWTSTTFTMGDGHTKTCTATTIRPKTVKPATKPSPTCGYTYQTKSKIGHPYTVTADTHWRINWATNGYQGTFTHTYTGNRTLEIGELQSLING